MSRTTHGQNIKSFALKTTLTVEETNSILTAYNAFSISYVAKNPPSFGHIISTEELREAYAKYHYQLLFEHINLTYRDLVFSKGTPALANPGFGLGYGKRSTPRRKFVTG